MELLRDETAFVRSAPESVRINKRDLACLNRFCEGKYGVRIAETTARLWVIEVSLENGQRSYELENRQGVLRVWRSLAGAIAFVQENCTTAAEVLVDVHGWRMMKLDEQAELLIR